MRRTDPQYGPADFGADTFCSTCQDANPQVRYTHYLAIAKLDGLEGIKKHLDNATSFQTSTKQGVVQWVKDQMEMWAGLADSRTGAAIPWHEARQLAIKDLRNLGLVKEPAYTARIHGLRQAEQAQKTARDRAWVDGHAQLNAQGLNKPGREAEAAAFCQKMAEAYPQDAAEWMRESEAYALMASGKPQWTAGDDNEDDIPF